MLRHHTQKTSAALLSATLLAALGATPADADGRYRAEVIQGGSTPQVFILDSRDGHFWTWTQTIRGSDQELRYEGQLKPGKAAGETISRSGVHSRR
jgi:hypothetical protein